MAGAGPQVKTARELFASYLPELRGAMPPRANTQAPSRCHSVEDVALDRKFHGETVRSAMPEAWRMP